MDKLHNSRVMLLSGHGFKVYVSIMVSCAVKFRVQPVIYLNSVALCGKNYPQIENTIFAALDYISTSKYFLCKNSKQVTFFSL